MISCVFYFESFRLRFSYFFPVLFPIFLSFICFSLVTPTGLEVKVLQASGILFILFIPQFDILCVLVSRILSVWRSRLLFLRPGRTLGGFFFHSFIFCFIFQLNTSAASPESAAEGLKGYYRASFFVSVILLLSPTRLLNPSECRADNVLGEIT